MVSTIQKMSIYHTYDSYYQELHDTPVMYIMWQFRDKFETSSICLFILFMYRHFPYVPTWVQIHEEVVNQVAKYTITSREYIPYVLQYCQWLHGTYDTHIYNVTTKGLFVTVCTVKHLIDMNSKIKKWAYVAISFSFIFLAMCFYLDMPVWTSKCTIF